MSPQKFARRLVLIFAFVTAPFLLAACDVTATCNSVSFNYSLDPSEAGYLGYILSFAPGTQFVVVKGATVIGSAPITLDPENAVTISFPAQPSGTSLQVDAGESLFSFSACGGGGKGANVVTWFNPGDGRVDGQPGDRLAVYCDKKTQSVLVWGVKPDSRGTVLGVFPNSDLLKAGMTGIFKPDGTGGQVSVDTDGKGNYWASWNGGQYNANGQPKSGFAKGFHCDFN